MKILYFSTPAFADCDFPLIKALNNSGVDVTYVISMGPYNRKSTLFSIENIKPTFGLIKATEYAELKIYESYMNMDKVYILNDPKGKSSSFATFKLVKDFVRFIKKEKFDVLHTDTFFEMHHAWLYLAGEWILTVHDPFPHTCHITKRKTLFYWVGMKLAKKFILLNKKQRNSFCKYYKVNKNRVYQNRLGVYDIIRLFLPDKISEKKNNVLFFGNISPYKGVEYLCKAMIEVRKQIPDATLTIAGCGKFYFDIEPYKNFDWIDIRNHFIELSELAGLIKSCSITICPYTEATQSGVIMTSYSLCKPVVATRVGGLTEMVEDGKTGVLVDPKDVTDLTKGILKILRNPQRLNHMSNYIEELFFKGEYSWNTIANGYKEIYKK